MPKDKEKSINPAAAARKAEKQKALKKGRLSIYPFHMATCSLQKLADLPIGKAAVATQRNERLAQRNPHRLQQQIDELKALEPSGALNPRDKKNLEGLERELARVKKAKEAVGNKHDQRRPGRDGKDKGVLGKRSRDERGGGERGERGGYRRKPRRSWDARSTSSSETDESVRKIPMPRDTPPPVPTRRPVMRQGHGTNANAEPLGERRLHPLPEKPQIQAQAVYEAKPVIRNLRKEAAAFVPAAVRRKQEEIKGAGGQEIYVATTNAEASGSVGDVTVAQEGQGATAAAEADLEDEMRRLREEEEQWRRETKQAQIEEVQDEEG